MRRVVLPVVLILLVRVDAWASTQDLDEIRTSKRVDAVPVDQPIRLDGILDFGGSRGDGFGWPSFLAMWPETNSSGPI